MVVDAADYFRALAEVLPQARRSITILGWEFDSRTRLLRCGEAMHDGLPAEIGPLLDALAGRRPGLEIRVLIWDSALLYAMNREFAGYIKMDWLTHPSLRFWFDDSHPIGASHHQKIVVVDDGLAFLGGLDVTSQRWDCREHLPVDPRRNDPAYPDYPPFHDVMAVVDGAAAAALADLCRERWAAASGERPAASPGGKPPPWPAGVAVLARNVPVAIARTSPPWDGGRPVHEVERLYLDQIGAARRSIFVENQYMASHSVAAALEARLRRPDCPEIVVVGPGEPASLLERSTMGVARARICRRLIAADRHGRLGLYTPVSGGGDVKVHSKLMVVDDRWLRVGSANLNNRSMGLDTECDLVIEAPGAARACRLDLLAEHLGTTPDAVAAAEARHGGMRAAIAALGSGARRLVPLDSREPERVLQIVAATGLPDPDQPVETLVWIDEGEPASPPRLGRRLLGLYAVLGAVVAAALLWPLAPPALWRLAQPLLDLVGRLRADPAAAAAVAGLVVLGGLLRAPPALMALAAAMLLGTVAGAALSLLGGTVSAVLLYLAGRELGRARVRRLTGAKAGRVKRALTRHGIFSVALLRLMPGAAFWVVNLVAGAGGVRLRDFVLGTIVGMAPGLFAMSVLGDQALRVLRRPDVVNIVGLAAAALVVVAAGLALVARLSRVGRGGQGRRILEV